MIFFLLVTLGTLLGSHLLIFFTTVRFFHITNSTARLVFLVVICMLALSFFLSAIFIRISSNPLTVSLMWISSLWLGLLLHLFAALALIWVTYLCVRVTGSSLNMKLVCGAFYGLAVLVTAYGVYNAFNVRLERVTVQIDDLPDSWKDQTIVQLSDVHLGSMRGTGFLRRLVDQVNALEPELVVIIGDLFDGMGGDIESLVELLGSFEASHGVFFVAGNHEGYLGLSTPLSIVERAGIRILDDEVVDVDGLQIVGVSFPEFSMVNKSQSISRLGQTIDGSKPSILSYHTPTDVAESSSGRAEQQSRTYLSPDMEFSFVREFGIDLQLSGHTHKGQTFPFNLLTRRIFNGHDYGLHNFGDFSLYVSSGTSTWGPPMRIGTQSEIVAIQLKQR